eukprot:6599596-Alexandrium_andersonii.AAC.1
MHDCWKNRKSIPWEATEAWATRIYRERSKEADAFANHAADGHAIAYNRGWYRTTAATVPIAQVMDAGVPE